MDNKPLIKDLCRERKGAKTNASIAAAANMSESTVANFFTTVSKAPSVYTAGPICRECGVSLDEYFGIAVDNGQGELDRLAAENTRLREELVDKDIDLKRKTSLIILGAGFILFFIAYMIVTDLLNPLVGLFRGYFSAAGFVALAGFVSLAVAVVYVLYQSFNAKK